MLRMSCDAKVDDQLGGLRSTSHCLRFCLVHFLRLQAAAQAVAQACASNSQAIGLASEGSCAKQFDSISVLKRGWKVPCATFG